MNSFIDRRALAPVCASLILLLCTFNLSCSSNPCSPVFSAAAKLKSTNFHSFGSAEEPDGSEITTENILINGTAYTTDHGNWIVNDSHDEGIDGVLSRFKTSANISCRLENTEVIDGENTDHYVTEGKWREINVHGQYWVSKNTGLLLRAKFKSDAGHGVKSGVSIRYEYTNITAPIVSK